MAYDNPHKFSSLETPIDLFVSTGNANPLKKALTDCALLEDFSDYLINLFNENLQNMDLAKATHDLVELAHDFAGNIEQQRAVMALMPHTRL